MGEYAGEANAELGAAELGTADLGAPELGGTAELGVEGLGETAALTLLNESRNTHRSPPADLISFADALLGTWSVLGFSEFGSYRGKAPPGCAVCGTCGGRGDRGGAPLGWYGLVGVFSLGQCDRTGD